MITQDYFIGRQPIYDRFLNVIGYELLYRRIESDEADFTDGDLATTQVLLNAFTDAGLKSVVGSQRAFINCTRNFLLEKLPIPLPPEQVVLEVLEKIPVDEALINALRDLRQRGFQIALDDVSNLEQVIPLLRYAHIVKLDLTEIDPLALPAMVASLRTRGLRVLAEKVETHQEFERCRFMGIDYYQGYFLCRPKLVKGQSIAPARLAVLQSLAALNDPDVAFDHLEVIVSQDVSLSYRLLRLVNSASYGLARRVTSIRQALSLIGIENTRNWMMLFLLADLGNKPSELLVYASSRGKMCESISKAAHLGKPASAFLVGLLSVLDALTDQTMEQAISGLPLLDDMIEALLMRRGVYGTILTQVEMIERNELTVEQLVDVDIHRMQSLYVESLEYANQVKSLLSD